MQQKALKVAKLIFKQFDTTNSNVIEVQSIDKLLEITYDNIGLSYVGNSKELESFLNEIDRASDGMITYVEYEKFLLRSLQ